MSSKKSFIPSTTGINQKIWGSNRTKDPSRLLNPPQSRLNFVHSFKVVFSLHLRSPILYCLSDKISRKRFWLWPDSKCQLIGVRSDRFANCATANKSVSSSLSLFGLFLFIFDFSIESTINMQNKFCRWLDSNWWPLELGETALPTEPHPLQFSIFIWLLQSPFTWTIIEFFSDCIMLCNHEVIPNCNICCRLSLLRVGKRGGILANLQWQVWYTPKTFKIMRHVLDIAIAVRWLSLNILTKLKPFIMTRKHNVLQVNVPA